MSQSDPFAPRSSSRGNTHNVQATVQQDGDELVVRIPVPTGVPATAASTPQQHQQGELPVVLIEERCPRGTLTWLCDLNRCDTGDPDQEMLMLYVMSAMESENNVATIPPGHLQVCGISNQSIAKNVRVSPPCYVGLKVVLAETNDL